jgi:hypothetical protein
MNEQNLMAAKAMAAQAVCRVMKLEALVEGLLGVVWVAKFDEDEHGSFCFDEAEAMGLSVDAVANLKALNRAVHANKVRLEAEVKAAWGVGHLESQWWNVDRGEQLHLLSVAAERL